MTEYTKEFTEKFWTARGFRKIDKFECKLWTISAHWLYPDGTRHKELPSLSDLNALRDYAIKPLQNKGYWVIITCYEHTGYCVEIRSVINKNEPPIIVGNDTLEEALVSAVSKVLGVSDGAD